MATQTTRRNRFTPAEAAALLNLSQKQIFRAIDEIPRRHDKQGDQPILTCHDLLYLISVREAKRHVRLPKTTKEKIYNELIKNRHSPNRKVRIGVWNLDITDPRRYLNERLAQLRKAENAVVSSQNIRGGDPVIKGTRIPVHMIADMLHEGASRDELLEGYPSLDDETLDLALIYASAHPRRGRPPKHPWHQPG